jgi:hypothetical protein
MMSSRQRWWSFERSVLKESPRNVVIADVRDFGNSIDHRTIIASLGDVHAELASAIESFLGVTMGRGSGIPQGVDASARLSSIVLDEIGREMAKGGWKCFQCSDDFRIGVMDRDEGEAALEHLSGNLADAGLTLNASKSLVMSVDDYRTKLESEPRGWLWEKLNHPRAEGLIHGPVGIAARSVIGLVRSLGRPSHADGELEARTIWDAARRLQDLAVAGDGSALPDLPRLIESQPVLTPVISGYLRKLATTECVSVTDRIIREPDLLDSQIAWLLRALLPLAPNLPEPMVDALRALASERGWIVRLEGMRILGARNESLAPSSERIPQQLADELELATAGVETRTFSRLGVDSTW